MFLFVTPSEIHFSGMNFPGTVSVPFGPSTQTQAFLPFTNLRVVNN